MAFLLNICGAVYLTERQVGRKLKCGQGLTFTLTGRGARSVHEVRLNVLLGSLTKLHKQSHQEQRGEAERGYQT